MLIRKRVAAALLTVPLALTACSGSGDDPAADAPSSAAQAGDASPTPGQQVDADSFFARTQEAMLAKKTYTMSMTMESQGESIQIDGVGDMSDPNAPKAQMTMQPASGSEPMEMILDGESIYMQMPGVSQGTYMQMPLSALAQAGGQDLTKFMNPAENLKLTQQAVEKVTFVGQEDVDGESLSHYTVTMNPQKLQQQYATRAPVPSSAPSVPSELPYEVWIDDEDLVRKTDMTMDGVHLTMTTSKYGEPVTITAPPSDKVTPMPGMGSTDATAVPSPSPSS